MKMFTDKFKVILTNKIFLLSVLIVSFAFVQVGCGMIKLDSLWRNKNITVDGNNSEWIGSMYYFEDDNMSVGFVNDDEFLYICMVAEANMLRSRILMQGLTIWFDPGGKKKKTLGIQFPLGREIGQGSRPAVNPQERPSREERPELREMDFGDLVLIGPGKDNRIKMKREDLKRVQVTLNLSSGMLVYELKIPFVHSDENPFALGVISGDTVGIGLEIPKPDRTSTRNAMSGGRSGRMPGAGLGGKGGGGRRGGMGSSGGRTGARMGEGIKVWAKVDLASNL